VAQCSRCAARTHNWDRCTDAVTTKQVCKAAGAGRLTPSLVVDDVHVAGSLICKSLIKELTHPVVQSHG
jgi:hypothetical protein